MLWSRHHVCLFFTLFMTFYPNGVPKYMCRIIVYIYKCIRYWWIHFKVESTLIKRCSKRLSILTYILNSFNVCITKYFYFLLITSFSSFEISNQAGHFFPAPFSRLSHVILVFIPNIYIFVLLLFLFFQNRWQSSFRNYFSSFLKKWKLTRVPCNCVVIARNHSLA